MRQNKKVDSNIELVVRLYKNIIQKKKLQKNVVSMNRFVILSSKMHEVHL